MKLNPAVCTRGGEYLTRQVLDGCTLDIDALVLDLGCGSGNSLKILAQRDFSALGVDLSLQLMRSARQKNIINRLTQARAEELPFASNCLDAILCECTLSLFALPTALEECARVLKPAGWLMVSDLYVRNPLGLAALQALPGHSCLSLAMMQEKLESCIQESGFKMVRWNDHSQALRTFPVCDLLSASQVDPFDLQIAAARARLGYFSLLARKET